MEQIANKTNKENNNKQGVKENQKAREIYGKRTRNKERGEEDKRQDEEAKRKIMKYRMRVEAEKIKKAQRGTSIATRMAEERKKLKEGRGEEYTRGSKGEGEAEFNVL